MSSDDDIPHTRRKAGNIDVQNLSFDQLLIQLGRESQSNARSSADSDQYLRGPDEEFQGTPEALKGIGEAILRRWSKTLYNFACNPDSEDADIKTKLLGAITGSAGGAAVIAGILVSSFGLSPAIAAIIAALVLKLFVSPAVDEICMVWGEKLEMTPKAASK